MIRVLIVEDSAVQRELLLYVLKEDGGFSVVGVAADGVEGVEMTARLRPDVILMDFHLPRMDGLAATREIMTRVPTPIVLASATVLPNDVALTFEAVRSGALAVIAKPATPHHPDFAAQVETLRQTLKLMAEVKVVRRWAAEKAPPPDATRPQIQQTHPVRVVAIGGSTGAPGVVADILSDLPNDLGTPVLLVQHIAPGFVDGYAAWLGQKTTLQVKVAADSMATDPGTVYVAPDGAQMGIGPAGKLTLTASASENGFRPSASYLFRSVAESFGPHAVGVLLTGMGMDGATGLLAMRRAGGITVAQDETSCVVFGMPRAAIEMEAAGHVLPPKGIALLIQDAASFQKRAHHVRF